MGKKRTETRRIFAATADVLIEEVTSGKWNDVFPNWQRKPIGEWDKVLKEFSLRCPGHTGEEYRHALARLVE